MDDEEMKVPETFVNEHREEINRCAYTIYQQRERYCQPDTPKDNFIRATEIVWERHQIATCKNDK